MSPEIESVTGSVPMQLYIGGKWLDADDGATIEVIDPSTAGPLAAVASGSPADAAAAVDAAADALRTWRRAAPRERADLLGRAFGLMMERQERLALLISAENGKALPDARAEVAYAAEFFRWFSEEAVRLTGSLQTAPGGEYRIIVQREPIGVAALVTPWNYPAAMATRKIAPALAAGCTVVLKPASDMPLTALALAELLAEAGAPPGVVNVLPAHRSGHGCPGHPFHRHRRGSRGGQQHGLRPRVVRVHGRPRQGAAGGGVAGERHGRAQPRRRLRPHAPFGGVKLSGLGREGGHEGMLEYTEPKYIATSR